MRRKTGAAACVGLLVMSVPVLAEEHEEAPRHRLVVLSASADPQLGVLTVDGENFGDGKPLVMLGSAQLVVVSSTPTQIVASLPGGLAPASYRLKVTRLRWEDHGREHHPARGDVDVFDVTIGAAGQGSAPADACAQVSPGLGTVLIPVVAGAAGWSVTSFGAAGQSFGVTMTSFPTQQATVPAGRLLISVFDATFSTASILNSLLASPGGTVEVSDLPAFGSAGSVAGRVTFADGVPVTCAVVTAAFAASGNVRSVDLPAKNGSYSVFGIQAGAVTMSALETQGGGRGSGTGLVVARGTSTIDIVLDRPSH